MPEQVARGADSRPVILESASPGAVGWTVDALLRGGIVAFPTDTVYGLAAAISHPTALARLYQVKQRPLAKSIPLLLASAANLTAVAAEMEPGLLDLVAPFWPGSLTVVLPARDDLPEAVTTTSASGRRTVAVRVPNHILALTIIEQAGGAVAATSANTSGAPPALTAREVAEQLGSSVDLILDGGRAPGGIASTIVEIAATGPVVLRQGTITAEDLRQRWRALGLGAR